MAMMKVAGNNDGAAATDVLVCFYEEGSPASGSALEVSPNLPVAQFKAKALWRWACRLRSRSSWRVRTHR